MRIKNKVVMVCGGAGFIGSHVVDKLLERDVEKVVIVDNFFLGKMRNIEKALRQDNKTVLYREDCKDYEKMNEIVRNECVEVAFNLAVVPLPASLVRPIWCYNENVRIVETLSLLLYHGAYDTLIHISSSEAYGTAKKVPMSEEDPLMPMTPYAASKAAGDHLIESLYRTFGLDISIVRPFNNYGPRQNEKSYAGVIPTTIKRIMNGLPPIIFGDGLQTRDYMFVEEAAVAILDVYEHTNTRGEVINIGSGQEVTIKSLIEKIMEIMNYNGDIVYKPPRIGDVRRHLADITKAKKLIGFSPKVTLDEGLRITVEWYRKIFGS